MNKLPEVWLRGPLADMPSLLQPVAHALLQAREEINELMTNFPEELLFTPLYGMASVGFHLQHLNGVLDRLFTYAAGNSLTKEQLDYLQFEGKTNPSAKIIDLVNAFNGQVDKALVQLQATSENTLIEFRGVGRAQLPSTVIGLYVHAAEHTMRHVGQLLITARVMKDLNSG